MVTPRKSGSPVQRRMAYPVYDNPFLCCKCARVREADGELGGEDEASGLPICTSCLPSPE